MRTISSQARKGRFNDYYVHSSEWKWELPVVGNDIVWSVWQHTAAVRRERISDPFGTSTIKNAKWDTQDGYFVPRECYNSYFYVVEKPMPILDKFMLHGERMTGRLDGGSALHLNLDEHLTKEQYRQLMNTAIKLGCSYWTVNVPNTICNDCGFITKHNLKACPKCGSENVDYATRVIG